MRLRETPQFVAPGQSALKGFSIIIGMGPRVAADIAHHIGIVAVLVSGRGRASTAERGEAGVTLVRERGGARSGALAPAQYNATLLDEEF